MKIKRLILLLFFIPLVSAEPIYLIQGTLNNVNVETTEGFVSPEDLEGEYSLLLIKNEEVLYEHEFQIYNTIEVYPGPECFDENMLLDEEICPEAFTKQIIQDPKFTLQIPQIEADSLEIYKGQELVYSKELKKENSKLWLLIIGIIIIIIAGFLFRKYYKKQRMNE